MFVLRFLKHWFFKLTVNLADRFQLKAVPILNSKIFAKHSCFFRQTIYIITFVAILAILFAIKDSVFFLQLKVGYELFI